MRPAVSSDSSSTRLRASDPTATWNAACDCTYSSSGSSVGRRSQVGLHPFAHAAPRRGCGRRARRAATRRAPTPRTARSRWHRRGGRRASTIRPRLAGSTVPTTGPPPGPRRIVIRPCTSSSRRPSRSDSRLTLYCSSIAASGGRPSPGCSPAAMMSCTTSRAIASEVFSGRVIAPPERMASGRRTPSAVAAGAPLRGAAGRVWRRSRLGLGLGRRCGRAPLREHDAAPVGFADLVEPHLHRHAGHEVVVAVERTDEPRAGERRRGRRARRCRARDRRGAPDASRRSTSAAWLRRRRPPSGLPSCRSGGSRRGARGARRRTRCTGARRARRAGRPRRSHRCRDRRRRAGGGRRSAIVTAASGSARCRAAAASR